MDSLSLLVVSLPALLCAYLCFLKDKPLFGLIGIASTVPALALVLIWFPLAGAIRVAKPNSKWAKKRYGPDRMALAHQRFPVENLDEVARTSPAKAPAFTPPPPPRSRGADLPERRAIIRQFLENAYAAGVITDVSRAELVAFAEGTARLPVTTAGHTVGSAAPPPPLGPPVWPVAPAPPPIEPPVPRTSHPEPAVQPGPRVPDAPPVAGAQPAVRMTASRQAATEAGPFRTKVRAVWDALASDIAVHGFMYLGVLVTFVALLGFLVFSFASVPKEQKPFFELGIATIFFGWAWILRRFGVVLAAKAMELVGGLVLPLIVFAGFVDGVELPPDVRGGALIVAMTATAVLLAGGYALVAARRPDSTLRFLVAPLLWLAAMTLGFVFKSDEPLGGVAITHLVSAQPALAAAAMAVTLTALRRRPAGRLTEPSFSAALVGLPIAYLLTLALAVGEGWTQSMPIVLLGVSTLVTVELVARHFDRVSWLPTARPLLWVGVVAPLAPTLGPAWTAVVMVASYLGMLEHGLRDEPRSGPAVALASAGVVSGASLALMGPWTTLVVFGALWVWTNYRRQVDDDTLSELFMSLAALVPIGVGHALLQLLDPPVGWLVMATTLAAMLALRVRRGPDAFWTSWLMGASTLVAIGAATTWGLGGQASMVCVAAVAVATIPLAGAARSPAVRLWLGAVGASSATMMAMATAQVTAGQAVVSWTVAGVALVVSANLRRTPLLGHLGAVGHLIGAGALLAASDETSVVALWGWTLAWVASATTVEAPNSVAALFGDAASSARRLLDTSLNSTDTEERAARQSPSSWAVWFVPSVAVASIPAAVVSTANLSASYAANRPWTGVTLTIIAALYAFAARSLRQEQVTRVLAIGATAASLLGVAVAVPAPWPMIVAACGVILAALLLRGTYDQTWFVWVAWGMSVLAVVLVAERAGVAHGSLHQVAAVWGGALLVAGLVVDDLQAGRRRVGEGLRIAWLRHPVIVGALVFPLGLGPVFDRPAVVFGWWALAGGALYLLVAWLIRLGVVAVPGYMLVVVAVGALSPRSMLDEPWLIAPVVALLLATSWLLERRQPDTARAERIRRWDLAPFGVAHAAAVFALAAAVANGDLAATGCAFGLLALAVAAWKRHVGWLVAADLLLLLAALDAGEGWLSLALAATSLHAMVAVRWSDGAVRIAYQVVAVAAAGSAWLEFLGWWDPGSTVAVQLSAILFGATGLAAAAAGRVRWIVRDTLSAWGGLAVAGIVLTLAVATAPGGPGIVGPWLALSMLALAGGFELAASVVHPALRLATVTATGVAWGVLIPGVDLSAASAVMATAVTFGAVAVLAVEFVRRRAASPGAPSGVASLIIPAAWANEGAVGVLVATTVYFLIEAPSGTVYLVAGGLALLAAAAGRAAQPFGVNSLRHVSLLVGVASVDLIAMEAGWSRSAFSLAVTLLAVLATAVSLSLWRRDLTAWVRPTLVLAAVANLQAVAMAVDALPSRSLLVAVIASVGVQAVAVGITRDLAGVLAAGPPLLGLAVLLAISESVSGSAQWYTVPIGLVVLSEADVVRHVRRASDSGGAFRVELVTLEWTAIALLTAPALVEMFLRGLGHGLVALALAGVLMVWAIVTRVRRRVVAAGSVAAVVAVLTLFAAAAASVPPSAKSWIVAVGIGLAVMLASAWIEAVRSRRGRVMAGLSHLMEDWE